MLAREPNRSRASRNLRAQRKLWNEEAIHPLSLGCANCPDLGICGGLHVTSALYNCLDLCCGKPEECDAVCRCNPEGFVRRLREVNGFRLDNVPHAPKLSVLPLPRVVPVVFHGSSRQVAFQGCPAVCLPLYAVVQRSLGKKTSATESDLAKRFRISPNTIIILTGTATDPPLERWWALGPRRLEAIRTLRELGVTLVTTPNFSLFVDQPRWDDLHSMKRIALVHAEFLKEGLPAALHVNARTEQDWSRWREYVSVRPEVTHVAFEFATGAGRADRISWQADQLVRLAATANRPLHLVLRGGLGVMPRLVATFRGVTLLETSAFIKTMKRKRAVATSAGELEWRSSRTKPGEPLDALLADNWRVVSPFVTRLCDPDSGTLRAAA